MSCNKLKQPTIVPPGYMQIEADMLARATKHILDSGDYIEAATLASFFRAKGLTAAQLKRWEKQGLIFTFSHRGEDYYPMYAFVEKPHLAIAKSIKIFERKDGRRLAFWFASVNGYLDGMRLSMCCKPIPKKSLLRQSDRQRVCSTAEIQLAGAQHLSTVATVSAGARFGGGTGSYAQYCAQKMWISLPLPRGDR